MVLTTEYAKRQRTSQTMTWEFHRIPSNPWNWWLKSRDFLQLTLEFLPAGGLKCNLGNWPGNKPTLSKSSTYYKSRIDAWGWWHVPQPTPIQSPRETISSCSTSTKWSCPTTKSYIPKLALRIPKDVWKTSATKTSKFYSNMVWLVVFSHPSEKWWSSSVGIPMDYYSQYMEKYMFQTTNQWCMSEQTHPAPFSAAPSRPPRACPCCSPGWLVSAWRLPKGMACFSGIDGYIHRQIYAEIDPTHHMYIYIYTLDKNGSLYDPTGTESCDMQIRLV